MLNQLNMSGLDKVDTAIERLRLFEPEEGYYLAFSGGKDSVVIKALADMENRPRRDGLVAERIGGKTWRFIILQK